MLASTQQAVAKQQAAVQLRHDLNRIALEVFRQPSRLTRAIQEGRVRLTPGTPAG
jgi:hypothetical protein